MVRGVEGMVFVLFLEHLHWASPFVSQQPGCNYRAFILVVMVSSCNLDFAVLERICGIVLQVGIASSSKINTPVVR
ncbi:hypothetical protein CEXT_382671 [Caerostris extrusa]|uniref:Secreted protein n=1 Tax=Caerostris extrusa TaxID=172846 RepID=A0AAV4UFJ6_CAEEX|nr:hypothetical protein CEXT_382671 [Caerostris extrusa]